MKPISPIVTEGFKALFRQSFYYLKPREIELRERYGLSSYQRYDWDQDTGTIAFSNDGVTMLLANIHLVGSVSTRTRTWLWSWANESISCRVSDRILEVKRYGERHGIPQLTEPYWSAGESDGWEMTVVSAYLLKAQGTYRTPAEHGFTYMLLTDIYAPPLTTD